MQICALNEGGFRDLKTGTEANQAVHRDADDEVDRDTPIHCESLMAQRVGKMRKQGKVVDRIAQKDRDEILQPTAGSGSEDRALRPHSLGAAGNTSDCGPAGQNLPERRACLEI